MWHTAQLTDKSQILAFLETDRLYAAYAIGDLEPVLFDACTWVGATEAGHLQALALHFRGLQPPALFLMGQTGGVRSILESGPCPEWAYFTCRAEHLPATRDFYAWNEIERMWRMVLPRASFRPVERACVRLTPAHADQLTALYALGGGIAYSAAQLERGVFFGIIVDGQLVAAAGTHLVSRTYGVAAVGNVFTHPHHRGHGFGTTTTSAVVAELQQQGIQDVVLNVNQNNEIAAHIYERLGFERYCPFLEGFAWTKRGKKLADENHSRDLDRPSD